MEKFSERLKELRNETGVSMKRLAEAIGVSDASVCKWENGIAEPKVTYLIKLSEFFNCSVDYLVGKCDDFGAVADRPNEQPQTVLLPTERKLVESYRQLTSNQKPLILETINLWNKLNEK